MKVFLTGASGYIGRHVASELLSRGHQVVGLARKQSERTEYSTQMEWCFADLSDFEAYRTRLFDSDAVVHCAMDYTPSGSENSELDSSFVSNLKSFQGRFIYTGNLFSDRREGELCEALLSDSEHWRFQTEVSVLERSDLASVIRLGFVYGSKGGYFWDILSPATLAKMEDSPVPEVYWPMVHVRDAASLYARVLESETSGVFHAFDGTQVQASEVIESTRSVYRANEIEGGESHDYINGLLQSSVSTSNERSRSIGWRPVHSSFPENVELAFSEFRNSSI